MAICYMVLCQDCVDMDCDGPKHSIINDVDGKLVQTTGERGSIIPRAEIRFDQSRLPETMRYSGESSKTRLDPNSLIDKRGIARGDNTYVYYVYVRDCKPVSYPFWLGLLIVPSQVVYGCPVGMHTNARGWIIKCS